MDTDKMPDNIWLYFDNHPQVREVKWTRHDISYGTKYIRADLTPPPAMDGEVLGRIEAILKRALEFDDPPKGEETRPVMPMDVVGSRIRDALTLLETLKSGAGKDGGG